MQNGPKARPPVVVQDAALLQWRGERHQGAFIFLTLASGKTRNDIWRRVTEARRKGLGLTTNHWSLPREEAEDATELAETMLGWCRDVLSGCRRPHGLDYFDLAIALRCGDSGKIEKLSLNKLRPIELYQESLPERLTALFAKAFARRDLHNTIHLSAGLFSWGEAVHQALPQT